MHFPRPNPAGGPWNARQHVCDPFVHKIRDDTMGTYINAIEEVLSRQQPDILVCMVSNNCSDRYSAIQKKCCVERTGTVIGIIQNAKKINVRLI
jgi:hypothetical protein